VHVTRWTKPFLLQFSKLGFEAATPLVVAVAAAAAPLATGSLAEQLLTQALASSETGSSLEFLRKFAFPVFAHEASCLASPRLVAATLAVVRAPEALLAAPDPFGSANPLRSGLSNLLREGLSWLLLATRVLGPQGGHQLGEERLHEAAVGIAVTDSPHRGVKLGGCHPNLDTLADRGRRRRPNGLGDPLGKCLRGVILAERAAIPLEPDPVFRVFLANHVSKKVEGLL
jgi:hypothetical protein